MKKMFWLRKFGLPSTEVAKRAGVSRNTLHAWVRGTQSPRLDHLERVARVLGVGLEDLVKALRDPDERQ